MKKKATTTISVIKATEKTTATGKRYHILELPDGSKVKCFDSDWGATPPMEIDTKKTYIYQPEAREGRTPMPILRKRGNLEELAAMGFQILK